MPKGRPNTAIICCTCNGTAAKCKGCRCAKTGRHYKNCRAFNCSNKREVPATSSVSSKPTSVSANSVPDTIQNIPLPRVDPPITGLISHQNKVLTSESATQREYTRVSQCTMNAIFDKIIL
ncbi:hypothetical protein GJ496_005400 [Pomphorhynchus laevis]|nr:hypothetical protein GJ496_005400 [Pomphorhynchus laevis]